MRHRSALHRARGDAAHGTRSDQRREEHYDRLVRSGQVDGVLLFSGHLPREGFDKLDRSVPILLICNAIPELARLPVVEVANRDAAYAMVEYLVGMGHRSITHITGPIENVEAKERLRGFCEATAAAPLDPKEVAVWEGAFSFDCGAKAGQRFLALPRRPSAMFCASDQIAIGFIKAVRDAGLSVPGDDSVAGFDDIEYAALFSPALTTMHQPRAELGRRAAAHLIARMTGDGKASANIRLPCTLVVRDSVQRFRPPGRKRRAAIQRD